MQRQRQQTLLTTDILSPNRAVLLCNLSAFYLRVPSFSSVQIRYGL